MSRVFQAPQTSSHTWHLDCQATGTTLGHYFARMEFSDVE